MQIRPVPQQRIIEKMDEYMSRRDYDGAGKHLMYWLEEALQGEDLRGQLMLRNELIGHFRKTGNRDEALKNVEEALHLLDRLDFGSSVSAGTTYVNAATACSAFGENKRAMALFQKARRIYESLPAEDPKEKQLLGGLYNNMALTCAALAKEDARDWYGQAFDLFEKALEQMREVPGGELEQAITYLNIADALEGRDGPEAAEKEIENCLDTAYSLLQTPSVPRDGYYAFVCEKCAPAFSYYGYFLAAEEVESAAESIYRELQQGH